AFEGELARRVALQLWRLRRAARYEAQVAADACAAARHAAEADPLHRPRPGLPAEKALADAELRLAGLKSDLEGAEVLWRLARELPGLGDKAAVDPPAALRLLALLGGRPEACGYAPPYVPSSAGSLRHWLGDRLR